MGSFFTTRNATLAERHDRVIPQISISVAKMSFGVCDVARRTVSPLILTLQTRVRYSKSPGDQKCQKHPCHYTLYFAAREPSF